MVAGNVEKGFSVWVVFNNRTLDYPGVFVCRRFESFGFPVRVEVREVVATATTLDELHQKMPKMGDGRELVCLAPHENDDPNILETWI
ncbi:MAG: hypothetical protein PHS86_11400 [Syntrophaceae bacterium]|nr:hypothetical protein [Syntrophaceae bacterium]